MFAILNAGYTMVISFQNMLSIIFLKSAFVNYEISVFIWQVGRGGGYRRFQRRICCDPGGRDNTGPVPHSDAA